MNNLPPAFSFNVILKVGGKMKSIKDKLQSANTPLISDGAWGTFLQQAGLEPGECPDLWSVTHRSEVLAIAKSYVDAGVDMIESNSFGANRFKLSHFGLDNRTQEINRAAAEISREAAGSDINVIASVGPTGKMLLMGDVTEDELFDAFTEQALALKEGGADAVCIETFTDIDEARIAIKAARQAAQLEIICTFTFEKTVNNDYRTMMGVSPAQMAAAMIEAGADIIGTNCGNGMERMAEIVREIRQSAPEIPILVHANAGMPRNVDGKTVFPESPEDMAGNAVAVMKAGANILGGCCGTNPDHIRAIKKAVSA